MQRVAGEFEETLRIGQLLGSLPEGVYAVGQYLGEDAFNQRGLFGTAAAIRVLSRSPATRDRIAMLSGLLQYLIGREAFESAATGPDAGLIHRLQQERRNTFKVSEVLEALGASPQVLSGRDSLITEYLARLTDGRLATGGWAVEIDPSRARDALATSSAVSALMSVQSPVDEVDVRLMVQDVEDSSLRPDIRAAILVRLWRIRPELEGLSHLRRKISAEMVRGGQGFTRVESNHEFIIDNRPYYVRIPWQLYLSATAPLARPFTYELNRHSQFWIHDAIGSVLSNEGFAYTAYSPRKSTRTYSVIFDLCESIHDAKVTQVLPSRIQHAVGTSLGVVNSSGGRWVLTGIAIALTIYSLVAWLSTTDRGMADLGASIAGAGFWLLVLLLMKHRRGPGG